MAGTPKKTERRLRWDQWSGQPLAVEELCDALACGESLLSFSRRMDLAYTTLRDWLDSDEERSAKYARARDRRADVLAERIEQAVDEPAATNSRGDVDPGAVAEKRLKVDTLKWVASKLAPRRYGDKIEVDATLKHDVVGDLREFLAQGRPGRLTVREG